MQLRKACPTQPMFYTPSNVLAMRLLPTLLNSRGITAAPRLCLSGLGATSALAVGRNLKVTMLLCILQSMLRSCA